MHTLFLAQQQTPRSPSDPPPGRKWRADLPHIPERMLGSVERQRRAEAWRRNHATPEAVPCWVAWRPMMIECGRDPLSQHPVTWDDIEFVAN